MSAAIEWANGLAGHWARGMWPVLWQTAALAAIIGLIVLCHRRMSPALRFWLWMLVPLRLLVMPLITISLPVLARPADAPPPAILAPASIVSAGDASPAPPEWTVEPAAPIAAPRAPAVVSPWSWLMIAWAAGVCLFALRLARGLLRMRRIAAQARESGDTRVRDCAREAAAMLGLRKPIRIMTAAEDISPFVLGFIRPVVVLPAALAGRISAEELRAVLAHEFAHVRRRDALIGWVLASCDLIYFFNPVVHFVRRRIMFERERACDEQVLALARAPRAVYARALLSAADLSRAPSQRLSCAPVLLESSRHLEQRLKLIRDEQTPRAGLSRLAKVCLFLVAVLALPGITCTERTAMAPAAPTVTAPADTEMMKQDQSNLAEIIKGVITYQGLNHDKLPPSLADLFPSCLKDPKVLICPADKAPMKIKYALPCSYRYIGDIPWRDIAEPNGPSLIIAYDHTPHDGGRNVAFFDGHVAHLSELDFTKALARLYEQLKPLMAKPDFPGDRDRVKAFCEDKDFPEEPSPAASPAARAVSKLKLPPAVVKAIEQEWPAATIDSVRLLPRPDRTSPDVWQISVKPKQAERVFAKAFVTETGVITRIEAFVTAADLPKAVADAVDAAFPAGKVDFKRAMRVEVRADQNMSALSSPQITYLLPMAEKSSDGLSPRVVVVVTKEGIVTKLSYAVLPADLPKAVAEAVAAAVPGGRVMEVQKAETRVDDKMALLSKPVVAFGVFVAGPNGWVSFDVSEDGKDVKNVNLASNRQMQPQGAESPSAPDKTQPPNSPSDATSPLNQKIAAFSLPGVSLPEAVEILRTQVTGMNFVIDRQVSGNKAVITLDLRNVTLAQALEAILTQAQLICNLSYNVVYISTQEGCAAYSQYAEPAAPEGSNLQKMLNTQIKAIALPGISLPEAITILQTQFKGLKATIDPALLPRAGQVQVVLDLREVPLRVVLKNILAPYGLEYTIVGDGICIKEKAPAAPAEKPNQAAPASGNPGQSAGEGASASVPLLPDEHLQYEGHKISVPELPPAPADAPAVKGAPQVKIEAYIVALTPKFDRQVGASKLVGKKVSLADIHALVHAAEISHDALVCDSRPDISASTGSTQEYHLATDATYVSDFVKTNNEIWVPVLSKYRPSGVAYRFKPTLDGDTIMLENVAVLSSSCYLVRCSATFGFPNVAKPFKVDLSWDEPVQETHMAALKEGVRLKLNEGMVFELPGTIERGQSNLRATLKSSEISEEGNQGAGGTTERMFYYAIIAPVAVTPHS